MVCGARSCVPPHVEGPPCDLAALRIVCSRTPHCAGFNSDGWLKPCVAEACGARVQRYPGVDTFVASSMVPGPFPPVPSPPTPPPTPPPPEPPVPAVPQHEDWHYPAEEPAELAAEWARGLEVISLSVRSNRSGTLAVRLAAEGPGGASASASVPGDVVFGWTLRGFLASGAGAPSAVLERDWDRWGHVLFLSATGRLVDPAGSVVGGSGFRKGVGSVAATRRPRYNLTAVVPEYFSAAATDPLDFLKRGMMARSEFNETTFVAAAAQLPPTHDYGIVGNAGSHTKFSVAQDGRVRLANFSIFSPTLAGNVTDNPNPGVLLFDPRRYLQWWPAANFSDYKTSVIGRYSRAMAIAAWDVAAEKGFAMEVVPNTRRGLETAPYDMAELLVRLKEHGVPAARYFAVRGCVTAGSSVNNATNHWGSQPKVPCKGPAVRELDDPGGGLFHANLLAHCGGWRAFFEGGHDSGARGHAAGSGSMQVSLHYDPAEASRLLDMARGSVAAAMTTFVGARPNYGDGTNYWSVSQKDRGSLPLESYALDHSLLLWGHTDAAAENSAFYFAHYVRGVSGLSPQPLDGVNSTAGPPGSIDLKHWDDGCAEGFADSFADYGRWLDLWAIAARAKEATGDATGWIQQTWPQIKLMAQYMLGLQAKANTSGVGAGLIFGPAEHDTCHFEAHWFSISAWTWRGFSSLGRYLSETAALDERPFAATLANAAGRLKRALDAALALSLVTNGTGHPYFVPPYAAVSINHSATGFKPYTSMVDAGATSSGGGASYANFRYFSEMLSAQFMGHEVDLALNIFRESHAGTLSGMTRFRDHLDDMPATGYAYSAIATDRIPSFLSLLFGHIANYQARGTFNAPEQESLYGDGGSTAAWTYSDSYRARLGANTEIDIDMCVPSTALVALMLRWMLVFEERDADVLWLLKAAPRRFYTVGTAGPPSDRILSVANAPTRFGNVSYQLDAVATSGADASLGMRLVVSVSLSGRGVAADSNRTAMTMSVVARIRDPRGVRTLEHADVSAGTATLGSVDPAQETVTILIPVTLGARGVVNFTLEATLA